MANYYNLSEELYGQAGIISSRHPAGLFDP